MTKKLLKYISNFQKYLKKDGRYISYLLKDKMNVKKIKFICDKVPIGYNNGTIIKEYPCEIKPEYRMDKFSIESTYNLSDYDYINVTIKYKNYNTNEYIVETYDVKNFDIDDYFFIDYGYSTFKYNVSERTDKLIVLGDGTLHNGFTILKIESKLNGVVVYDNGI